MTWAPPIATPGFLHDLRRWVQDGLTVIVSGAPSPAKQQVLEAAAQLIPADHRVAAGGLAFPLPHLSALNAAVGPLDDPLERMRMLRSWPGAWIVWNEVCWAEAAPLLDALSEGRRAIFSVPFSCSPQALPGRLVHLARQAGGEWGRLQPQDTRELYDACAGVLVAVHGPAGGEIISGAWQLLTASDLGRHRPAAGVELGGPLAVRELWSAPATGLPARHSRSSLRPAGRAAAAA